MADSTRPEKQSKMDKGRAACQLRGPSIISIGSGTFAHSQTRLPAGRRRAGAVFRAPATHIDFK
jgi:hypothetical protein